LWAKRLYRRLRPLTEPVLFSSLSMFESLLNPRPTIPLAPSSRAGFAASLVSSRAWLGIVMLETVKVS
jgi:hypothetical protein